MARPARDPNAPKAEPKTVEEKIAALEARIAALRAGPKGAAIAVSVGDNVTFNFGRGEKRRAFDGVIVGARDDEKQGLLLAVTVGEGFEAETYRINVRDVSANNSVEAPSDEAADPLAS